MMETASSSRTATVLTQCSSQKIAVNTDHCEYVKSCEILHC